MTKRNRPSEKAYIPVTNLRFRERICGRPIAPATLSQHRNGRDALIASTGKKKYKMPTLSKQLRAQTGTFN